MGMKLIECGNCENLSQLDKENRKIREIWSWFTVNWRRHAQKIKNYEHKEYNQIN